MVIFCSCKVYSLALPLVALRDTVRDVWKPPVTSESTQILTLPASSPTLSAAVTNEATASAGVYLHTVTEHFNEEKSFATNHCCPELSL